MAGVWVWRTCRRLVRWLVLGLAMFGRLYPLSLVPVWPADEDAGDPSLAPAGMTGHPERLAHDVPLSDVERWLWHDLGWLSDPPRSPV